MADNGGDWTDAEINTLLDSGGEDDGGRADRVAGEGGGGSWSQPVSPYGTHYPYNLVYASEFGHVKEVDDTIGARRLHWWHSSHTFIEIDEAGNKVCKTVGDDYEITIKNRNVLIKGNCNVTIEGNSTMLVKGNSVTQVQGNAQLLVEGDSETHVMGDCDINVDQDMTTIVDGDSDLVVDGDIDIKSQQDISVRGNKKVSITSGGLIDIKAPKILIQGADVDINGHVKINGITQVGA